MGIFLCSIAVRGSSTSVSAQIKPSTTRQAAKQREQPGKPCLDLLAPGAVTAQLPHQHRHRGGSCSLPHTGDAGVCKQLKHGIETQSVAFRASPVVRGSFAAPCTSPNTCAHSVNSRVSWHKVFMQLFKTSFFLFVN